jgi:hypothetical protein
MDFDRSGNSNKDHRRERQTPQGAAIYKQRTYQTSKERQQIQQH